MQASLAMAGRSKFEMERGAYIHTILTRCPTFLNSGSPVMIDASTLRAVATAKQSAYEMAYSALISEADNITSDEGGIIRF